MLSIEASLHALGMVLRIIISPSAYIITGHIIIIWVTYFSEAKLYMKAKVNITMGIYLLLFSLPYNTNFITLQLSL